jgi:GH15 family glucan-1,4-alpha-glucosidase
LIPAVGFLPIDDHRVQRTIKTVETELIDKSGFVLRYRTDAGSAGDGLPAGEGAFLACSFWLADTYMLAGRLSEATQLFERLLELANDLGLLAEEYDAPRGALTGNFPQALTHVSLVHTAQLVSEGVSPGMPVGRWLGPRQRHEVGTSR